MNIGIIIPEIGGYTSLSIEFQKWYAIMVALGHSIHIITGRSKQMMKQMTVMSDLHHESDFNIEFASQMFQYTDENEQEIQAFKTQAIRIQGILDNWATTNALDVIVVENYFSIPSNLPVSYATYLFFQNYECKKIIKHHDAFYRGNVNKFTQNSFIKQVLLACFPIDMKDTFHISCNRIIKSYLKEKCNVDSIIIPYVMDPQAASNSSDLQMLSLSDGFQIFRTDKVLVHFSDLLPSSKHDQLISLLEKINDDSFKIVSIVRKHRDYGDYHEYLNQIITDKGLKDRLVLLSEDEVLGNDSYSLDDLFRLSKGTISLDLGVSFGQPIHKAIQNKCDLLFCTESQIDWLELSDLGCKMVNISDEMNQDDVIQINRHLNDDTRWGEQNYTLMEQYYSKTFLKYLLNNLLLRI
ncbi:MAG: hypothetical protein ACON35_05315 [Candidatus Marinamargulisbacteria bacterium]